MLAWPKRLGRPLGYLRGEGYARGLCARQKFLVGGTRTRIMETAKLRFRRVPLRTGLTRQLETHFGPRAPAR